MAVSLEIIPFTNSLDMFGDPDRNAAYSLSGHINITLSSPFFSFDRKRSASLLLQSLVVTFEGQTELISEETSYSALRLCSISQELVTGDWIELSNDDSREPTKPCSWSIVFNLTIPGWLPESSAFGDRDGGTCYALHACATIHNGDAAPSQTWLSNFCTPFQPSTRVINARHVSIPLNRYTAPSSISSGSGTPFPHTRYEVSGQLDSARGETSFPRDILPKIRVQMSVPRCVNVEGDHVSFSIRLKTKGLSEYERKRLRVSEFHVDIEQGEKYRSRPMSEFTSRFSIPPPEAQPPHTPLLQPHPLHSVYDMGLTPQQPNSQLLRSFSLLSPDAPGHYKIAGDGYIFAQDDALDDDAWFSLSTRVQLASHQPEPSDWRSRRTIRTSSLSPFLSVHHRMYVTLLCTYDVASTSAGPPERVAERLRFHIPLKFVKVLANKPLCDSRASTPSLVGHSRASSEDSAHSVDDPRIPLLSAPSSYASSLPAYSQLYHNNGDRKIDYSIPLPLYTPRTQEPIAYSLT